MSSFRRDWTFPPEPPGDDEPEVIALYLRTAWKGWIAWEDLPETTREAWRREFRETESIPR